MPSGGFLTTEEICALLVMRGFPLSAFEDWTLGMVMNYCYAYDRQQKRMNGEEVSDPEEQYLKLKAMQPQIMEMYKAGQIRKERYKSFMESIENYERVLKEG